MLCQVDGSCFCEATDISVSRAQGVWKVPTAGSKRSCEVQHWGFPVHWVLLIPVHEACFSPSRPPLVRVCFNYSTALGLLS